LVLKTDSRGYVFPDKKRAKEKIDPIVALILGLSEVLFQEQEFVPATGEVHAI
jgi:phage terminase large subunit-like protein